MDASRNYRIGEIAERPGVSVETLRYYEKRRLLNAPGRTEGGFRVYSDAVVYQVKFIKQAQSLGLMLDDIQQLAAGRLRKNHAPSCRKVRDLLTRRIEDIDARIKELRESWCCSWVAAARFTARVQGAAGHTTAEDCSVSS